MIDITSILHYDEYTGTGATGSPYLMGSFMDKITTKVQISVHWETLNLLCTFNSANKTITRNDNRSFYTDEWSVGDTFTITGTSSNNGNFTINFISADGSTITTAESLTNESCNSANLYATTPINCLDFYFNLIPNNSVLNFNSLTDTNQPCKKTASKTTWNIGDTVNLVQATSSIAWDNGSGTVRRNDDSGYKKIFLITHTYFISPYYLTGQQVCTGKTTDLSVPLYPVITGWGNIVYPPYFINNNTLKYVCSVNSRTSISNPNIYHSTSLNFVYPLGNVGYLNEFLNGGIPEYSLINETITDTILSVNTLNFDVRHISTFDSYIKSASGNFLGGGAGVGSHFIVDIFYCPQTPTQYTGTTTTNMNQNFLLDRIVMDGGQSVVNGENFGTNYQMLVEGYVNVLSPTSAEVGFNIAMSSYVQSFMLTRPSNDRHFMITVTCQKKSATSLQTTDRNIVLLYFDNANLNREDGSLLTFTNTLFHQYPDTSHNTFTDYKGFIGDLIYTQSYFTVDNTAILNSVKAEIQAINTVTGDTIVLQTTNNSIQNDDGICQPISETNRYKLPITSPYNQTVFNRNVALDTPTAIGYEYDYGFIGRYEEWVKVPEASKLFTCENTQDWSIYSLEPNWTLAVVITAEVTKDDFTTTFIHQAPFILKDESFSNDGSGGTLTNEIQTYFTDISGLKDAKGLILDNTNTLVVMTITGNFSSLPAGATGYGGYLALDVKDSGGVYYRDIVTTSEQPLSNSLWIKQAVVDKVNNSTITIQAEIDYTKIPKENKSYTITGRLTYIY